MMNESFTSHLRGLEVGRRALVLATGQSRLRSSYSVGVDKPSAWITSRPEARGPRRQCDLQNPNFAGMAQSMGIKGVRVEAPQDLRSAVQDLLSHKGPALLDVVTPRQELVMPPATTFDETRKFGVFMLKAVLDGRAGELIDLAKGQSYAVIAPGAGPRGSPVSERIRVSAALHNCNAGSNSRRRG
jgi:hypothetical protein